MFKLFHRSASLLVLPDLDPSPTVPRSIAAAGDIDTLMQALIDVARARVGSDGVTLVQRNGDMIRYVGEDAISPLWAGQSFPLRTCVSGMTMESTAPIVIPDIAQDRRVPLNLYLATFVRSMAIVPIGRNAPRWAIGAYWRDARPIPPAALAQLTLLADAAAAVLARLPDA